MGLAYELAHLLEFPHLARIRVELLRLLLALQLHHLELHPRRLEALTRRLLLSGKMVEYCRRRALLLSQASPSASDSRRWLRITRHRIEYAVLLGVLDRLRGPPPKLPPIGASPWHEARLLMLLPLT